ncbi:exo-alpha-sialidase [Prosthecobacter sp.]|uniref:exo-alpha-sialidase n=1 Tax=Prosthecobacter sp. TaxID=1965333 RepID=UPI0037839565
MKAALAFLLAIGACFGADFRIENSTVLTSTGAYHWSQSRAAVIPGDPARVMITTQEFEKQGSHGYRDIYSLETTDGAKTWSNPQRIESLDRKMSPLGVEMVMGDLCPQWHAASRKVLVTGKTFGFRKDAKPNEAKDDRAYERVAYSVYSPDKGEWSGLKIMAMPEKDHAGHPIIEPNAGCNQRFDLPNGEVLLPVRYRHDPKLRTYTTIVARCTFDGETLTYREHGSELTTAVPRGLYEPSVTGFKGRYFLTMRAEKTGYVARGTDGINYEPAVEWKFDDGRPVGTYCTQQHWIVHEDGLYLIYTRKGANNDHVFRHRAPIFIARVDPDQLHVIRATEQILMPETGVDLGGGYAPVAVNEKETWVISTEMAFPKNRQGENNRILLAKIIWNQP